MNDHRKNTVILSAWVDPVLRDYARAEAKASGVSFSEFVSRAVELFRAGRFASQAQAAQSVLDATARAEAAERELAAEREAHELEKRAHEHTWQQKVRQIERAEAAEKRDATRIEGIMAQIADLERDRDHWRTVAESRPDISREDAGKVALAPTDDLAAVIRVSDALRDHAAAPKGDDTSAPGPDADPCIECDGKKFVYERSDFDGGTFRIPCPECNRTGRAGGGR